MTARDLYGLAVRLAGLVFWVFAAFDLVYAIVKPLGIPLPSRYTESSDLVITAAWILLGIAATAAADILTRFAYGKGK